MYSRYYFLLINRLNKFKDRYIQSHLHNCKTYDTINMNLSKLLHSFPHIDAVGRNVSYVYMNDFTF